MGTDPSEESLRAAFDKCWVHARHVEKQKYWYTSVYAVIIAGSVVLVQSGRRALNDAILVGIVAFLGFLTVAGIVVVMKTSVAFYYHMLQSQQIALELEFPDRNSGIYGTPLFDDVFPDQDVEWSATSLDPRLWGRVNTSYLVSIGPFYLLVYHIVLGGLTAVFVTVLGGGPALAAFAAGVVFVVVSLGMVAYFKWKFELIDDHVV